MNYTLAGTLIGNLISIVYCKVKNISIRNNNFGVSPAIVCVITGMFAGGFFGYCCEQKLQK